MCPISPRALQFCSRLLILTMPFKLGEGAESHRLDDRLHYGIYVFVDLLASLFVRLG